MEKMRRARINDSLNELKSLVLEAMKKDVSFLITARYWRCNEKIEYLFYCLDN